MDNTPGWNPHNYSIIIIRSELLYIIMSDGIAWDWLNKKLYWSDTENQQIEVMDPNTRDRMQLVETGLNTTPRDVAVDPNTR